jgi:hypothetical protein
MKSILKMGLLLMTLVPAVIARGQSPIISPLDSFPVKYTLPTGYPNINASHYEVSAMVYVYTTDPEKKIDKPIIVPEGFDPDNSKNWPELYYAFNVGQRTMDCLVRLGYDFVIINFDEGSNFIEHNSYLFTQVVAWVNGNKTSGQKNIVIGPSMGGLIARYGLTYMEKNNMNHDTRLFVSMDAPQYGANVPLGIQRVIGYFENKKGDQGDAVRDQYGILQSLAARQMLIYHFNMYNVAPDPLRTSFEENLSALGNWPTKLRKVAMSNGSGYGSLQLKDDNVTRLQPGDAILDFKKFKGSVSGDIVFGRAYAIPENVKGKIARVKAWEDLDPNDYYVIDSKPLDNMAGGYRTFTSEIEKVENTADAGKQCFIPLYSALAITTTDNHYSVFNDPNVLSKTPFDAIYCPAENEQHVQITAASNAWLFNEIVSQSMSVSSNTFLKKGNIDLQARTEVRLLPGFSTGTNPTFHVFVGPFSPCVLGAPLATTENSTTEVTTGIEAVEKDADQLLIYPNPASDFVTINAQGQEVQEIELMQADGKLLKKVKPSEAMYQLDLSDVSAGMYFIRVSGNKEYVVKKIVVTH